MRDRRVWQALADKRRQERAEGRVLDTRAVLYDRSMLEFVAREVFAAFARREQISAAVRAQWADCARQRSAIQANISPGDVDSGQLTDDEIAPQPRPGEERYASPFYDTLKKIHSAWLLTARDDLGGASPRDVAYQRHDHVTWDMQHRCEHWSRLNECPPALAESSFAFRYGGFGTHEWVMYYELVRELLCSTWERLSELAQAPRTSERPETLAVGDFLATEVPRLERVREGWLDAPKDDFHQRTPRSIIDRERAGLPEGMASGDAMIDQDCPCCQMLADMDGPAFWHLDGSEMDDDFAFDLCHRTRDEWEQERRESDEHCKRFDAQCKERELLGVTGCASGADESMSI